MPTKAPFEQTDLFGQPIPHPEEAPQAPLQALRVTAAHTGRKLSPAQQSFNKLLSRIHNVTEMLQALDARVHKFQAPTSRPWPPCKSKPMASSKPCYCFCTGTCKPVM